MAAGAVVFASNVAPTEEVVLLAAAMAVVLALPASLGAAAARLVL